MQTVALPRVVLLLALTVLAGSLAVLVSTTGVISANPSGSGYDFVVEDNRLIETSGDDPETLIADVSTVERIEISDIDTDPVVSTTPREPATVNLTKRKRAKQIVTSDESVSRTLTDPPGAVYTIRPIPETMSNDRAAIVGVSSEPTSSRLLSVDQPEFTVRNGTAEGTVILERTDHEMSDRRALVVVDPIRSQQRYSVVVDLENETIEAFVRFGGASE
jgi:hypothetical protein